MLRQTLSSIAAAAFLLGASIAAHGQEPDPAPVSVATLAEEGLVKLVYAWRYHPGDDARWADPALGDSDWELVEPQMAPGGLLPRSGRPGTGWFRRHLRVEPALQGKPVVIRVESPGAATVFLDGAPLMETTAPGSASWTGGAWRSVVFSPRPDHVLAVRYTVSPAGAQVRSGNPGFLLTIESPNAAAIQAAAQGAARDHVITLRAVFTAVPALLALLHLVLFLFYPKARENLFQALGMASMAAIVFFDLSGFTSGLSVDLTVRVIIASSLSAILFSLFTYYSVRARAFPRTWIALTAVGAALAGLTFFAPETPSPKIWFVYFGLVVAEIIRLEAIGWTVHREGGAVLLGGFAALLVLTTLHILGFFSFAPMAFHTVPYYLLGMLVFEIALSIFVAQNFARTSRHLDEQEIQRRLLEAQNARTTSEIEAARALQVSMLPAALPVVEGLETAAVMATASEVGGDYYDFRIAPDGSLVVAFGDATGHGVAAGIMVTAVKALFSTLGGGESLSAVLAECDRVLREMQVKPLHMCLMLARLTPRSVTLCSAAMPPVLIHRADSGAIEELGSGGRPIGSRLSGAWTEHSSPLSPGDTLLFASDGFAEQLDPAETPFGYERMADAFRAAAGVSPGELAERLLAEAAAWRGNREQGDDLTLVVVRRGALPT